MATLKNICTFFQNLNEYVYASDIETNELVYLNRKAMDAFGVKSTDEIRGRKCYEVLQGSSIPCGMCTNCQLSTGSFVEWRYYNPVLGRHLLLKDTHTRLGNRFALTAYVKRLDPSQSLAVVY